MLAGQGGQGGQGPAASPDTARAGERYGGDLSAAAARELFDSVVDEAVEETGIPREVGTDLKTERA